jgi:protein involved in polysaccharide export with SLBB domain
MTTPMTLISRLMFAGSLVLSAVLFSGCAAPEDGPAFSDGTPGKMGQPEVAQVAHFQIGDTVTINLSGPPEDIAPHVEPIKEDGTITMPGIGHVPAAGKTAGELQNTIYSLYVPKYYTHLTVTVTTGDRVYYVRGEVKSPGRQLYLGVDLTVTRAIATAGDFTDFANHKNVWLIHGNHRTKVNCDEAANNPDKDPLVYPGDQIEVRRRIF